MVLEHRLQPRRWINYAACLWALAFAAPHTWWALGFEAGFPGGPTSYHRFMTGWRCLFDVFVILLSLTAMLLALAFVRPWGKAIPRWILRTATWIACGMLTLRGVAGFIHDGASDLVWNPTFLAGGILFGCVAWSARALRPSE